MTRRTFLGSLGVTASSLAQSANKPNIVLIYADDVGFGDLSCYGATSVRTPNLDKLAASGLRFTNAHAPAATCTPSRYSMLTGEYAFRKPGTGVLPGDARMIIDAGRPTLASLLKAQGYRTGVIGKWHLGLGKGSLDWNQEIVPGPREIGFDYSFLMPATGDRVPCVYTENQRVAGLSQADPIEVDYKKPFPGEPTGSKNPELLRMHPSHGHDQAIVNGVSRIGYSKGGKSALWVDEDMAGVFASKAREFIARERSHPFFLYFATHDIHVPRLPNKRFAGKSPMGPRGDAILELDWTAGQVLEALDRHGLTQNTIVIFSSDNGPVVDDGYKDQAVEKLGSHRPADGWRGGKYSIFEGGTRVPMLLRWPARVKPGKPDALVCHIDFPASFAALGGQSLPAGAAPDSQDVMSALLGESKLGRDHLVEQAGSLALLQGDWKYIEPSGKPRMNSNTHTELGNDPQPQLYHLARDPGEKTNLASMEPERAKKMAAMLDRIKSGRDRA